MSNPLWFDRWEWRDWKGDALVRRLSKDARLLWFESLCDMHIENDFKISGTAEEFARAIGCMTPSEVEAALGELERLDVCGVTRSNGVITLVSRERASAVESRADRRPARIRRAERLKLARSRGTHTDSEWLLLLQKCSHRCLRCNRKSRRLTKDHIIPIAKGGRTTRKNLQALCEACNTAKGAKTMAEFMEARARA